MRRRTKENMTHSHTIDEYFDCIERQYPGEGGELRRRYREWWLPRDPTWAEEANTAAAFVLAYGPCDGTYIKYDAIERGAKR